MELSLLSMANAPSMISSSTLRPGPSRRRSTTSPRGPLWRAIVWMLSIREQCPGLPGSQCSASVGRRPLVIGGAMSERRCSFREE